MRHWLFGLALAALGSGACYSAGGADEDESAGGTSGTTSGGAGSGGISSRGGSSSAGSSSGGSSGAAGTAGTSSGIECSGEQSAFAGIDKTCLVPDDCILVNHAADCCGTIAIMGINAGALQSFSEVESYCSAQLPACGCFSDAVTLEDGTVINATDTSYAVECSEGQCRSHYSGASFACMTANCTATQYCQIVSGGPAGSGATGSCYPRDSCTDCSCINAVGCQCSVSDGNITVTCAAP